MEYDKGNYSTDKKVFSKNTHDHNPNDGENQMHFHGNSEGGRDESIYDSVGVADGLGSLEATSVKNAENVCPNQRMKSNSEKSGSFKIGT